MYTIKQAANRTGISIPTIRVWERRYSVVAPTRTPAGYRLYDEDAIARLVAMRQLIEHEGWRPSQAADRVRSADPEELASISTRSPSAGPPRMVDGTQEVEQAVEDLVDAARRRDIRGVERTLDDAFAAQRFEAAMDRVVFPALRGIGAAWREGDLDVAQEHAASETIRRRIAHYFDAAALDGDGPAVVVGLPPGSRHELGAFAFAVAARRAGLDVLYLGADVPLDAWQRTLRASPAAVAVLAVMSPSDVPSALDVVDALQTDGAQLVAVGGPAAQDLPVSAGVLRLPDAIEAAVATVRDVVTAASARSR
jgi:DNA-binding transcriptional MerR regulator